ncbi:hypothetical protein SEUCBS139899_008475 [Sporothrix eucalyptigena]|uniref:Penicillin-binding protein n=1 Tax=Sporothrix eucalyptigena TaxID=1812306 RepID=A0ABP0C9E8_9PEZI
MAHLGNEMQTSEDVPEPPTASVTAGNIKKTATKKSPLNAEFQKLVQETLDKWHIQGVAVAVVDGDETWAEGYGIAAMPDVPVRPSTLFYTGSTSKSFTAAAASLLVDDNDMFPKVQWTTPMSELIRDDFVLPDDYATANVTLEDALSNRSGLAGQEMTLGRPRSIRDYVRTLRHFTMSKPIRTTWQYCNGMFVAVGHMIEVLTGKDLASFLKERVWGPLGMTSTFWSLADAQGYAASPDNDATVAIPYAWDEAASQFAEIPYFGGVLGGAGAVISSVVDYAAYIRCIMRQTAPLSPAGHTALRQPRAFCPQMLPQLKKQMTYSLGWMLATYHKEDVLLHPGGLEGMTATMILFPERDWGVLVFSNSDGPGRETLAWHLIDEMLGVPKEERLNLFEVTQKKRVQQKEHNATAVQRLYPSVKSPKRPLSVPVDRYAGTFAHPAYPDFVVSITPGNGIRIDVAGEFRIRIELEHVTADFFTASIFFFRFTTAADVVVPAQFQVDASGKVTRFGAALDAENMPETLIWFDRAAENREKGEMREKE